MAEINYRLTDAETDSCNVLVWSDTAGDITIVTSSGTFGAGTTVDPSTNIGFASAAITCTNATDMQAMTIMLDGVAEKTGILRVLPADGEDFNYGELTCCKFRVDQIWAYQMVRNYNCRVVNLRGDTPYADGGTGVQWGSAGEGTVHDGVYADNDSVDDWLLNYRLFFWTIPGMKFLMENTITYQMWDDHEIGNDWDHSIAQADAFYDATITLQSEVDTIFNRARQAFDIVTRGRPTNTDADAIAERPELTDEADATNYPTQYWRKTIGPLEIFQLDPFTACSEKQVDDGASTQLGANQAGWAEAHVLASSAPLKYLATGKKTYRGNTTSDNGDWTSYTTERDALETAFTAETGLLWGGGDVHHAAVLHNTATNHVCWSISPASLNGQKDAAGSIKFEFGYTDNFIWRSGGFNGGANASLRTDFGSDAGENIYGIIKVKGDGSYMLPTIVTDYGDEKFTIRISSDTAGLDTQAVKS